MLCLASLLQLAQPAEISQVSVHRFSHGTPLEREAEVLKLRAAFEGQGMAVLVDHGVDKALIQRTIDASRSFFALPRNRKESFPGLPGKPPRSYASVSTPRGKEYLVQQEDDGDILNEWLLVRNTSVQLDPSDTYYTSDEGREFYAAETEDERQRDDWPQEVPGLRETTAEYYAAVERLTNKVYELFAVALELPADFFLSRARHAPIWPVTIAHYPPQRRPPKPGSMRIQPHWDRTLFALITTSDAGAATPRPGGLQIQLDEATGHGVDGRLDGLGGAGEGSRKVWRDVAIPDGSFVVNVGEMMARWTNGRFRHVVHRVPNPPAAEGGSGGGGGEEEGRISMMAYVLPDYDVPVLCADAGTCSGGGGAEKSGGDDGALPAPKYDPTWVGEMMNWGSELPSYNKTRQEQMRRAQGLYTEAGEQTALGDPTDVNSVEMPQPVPPTASTASASAAIAAPTAVDVIDIGPLVHPNPNSSDTAARRAAALALSRSFEQTGFALVRGHGVSAEALARLRAGATTFFRSPPARKASFDKGRGYGFGGYVKHAENGAQLLGDFDRPNDLVESLTLRGTSRGGGSGVESVALDGSCAGEGCGGGGGDGDGATTATGADWLGNAPKPDGDAVGGDGDVGGDSRPRWGGFEVPRGTDPEVPSELVEPLSLFSGGAVGLSRALAATAKLALGATDAQLSALTDSAAAGVRLAWYAAQDEATPPLAGQMRYGAHIDSGTVTVLSLDPTNPDGLQVDTSGAGAAGSDDERVWVDVPAAPGTLVLNVGALLSRWSCGRWRAAIHRVTNGDSSRDRLSVVTSALGARSDGPTFGGFGEGGCGAGSEPVQAAEFLATRVQLHRPEYRREVGIKTREDQQREKERIVSLHK